MLKMIIIDDERLIRNGLTDYLDWASLGIEISAVCANGLEGLEAIHAHHPDIVLTDIAMPCMDGVELLKTARGEGFGGQFIFISSYSEFRYAQEAVKYGAFDYLLKPLEASVLEDSVRRCIDAIHLSAPASEPAADSALAASDSLAPYTRKVIAMIETRYGESLTLGMAAHSLGISKSHLSATFKADTGCTFGDYLFAHRMKVAKELLEEGKYKIYEIAEKAGYPDLAQFSKRFKQFYGVSPRDMQKLL